MNTRDIVELALFFFSALLLIIANLCFKEEKHLKKKITTLAIALSLACTCLGMHISYMFMR